MGRIKLKDDEVFFPLDKEGNKGRIIQLHELQQDGRTLVSINQYHAIRAAQELGGHVLSIKEIILGMLLQIFSVFY